MPLNVDPLEHPMTDHPLLCQSEKMLRQGMVLALKEHEAAARDEHEAFLVQIWVRRAFALATVVNSSRTHDNYNKASVVSQEFDEGYSSILDESESYIQAGLLRAKSLSKLVKRERHETRVHEHRIRKRKRVILKMMELVAKDQGMSRLEHELRAKQ